MSLFFIGAEFIDIVDLSNLQMFSRWVAKIMVWTSLFLSIGLLLCGCIYCGFKYTEIKDVSGGSNSTDLISIGFTTDLDAYLELSSNY